VTVTNNGGFRTNRSNATGSGGGALTLESAAQRRNFQFWTPQKAACEAAGPRSWRHPLLKLSIKYAAAQRICAEFCYK